MTGRRQNYSDRRRVHEKPVKECVKFEHGFFRGEKCQFCGEEGEMIMSPRHVDKFGRIMAGILRHFPDRFDLEMNQQGWGDVGEFVEAIVEKRGGLGYLTIKHVKAIIETDPKGRYQFKDNRIRATYAHSIDLDLDLPTEDVPEHLYFACSEEDVEDYIENGLFPEDRMMVHLSGTRLNALEAGRHIIGKPVVLMVDVREAEKSGGKIMKAGTTVFVTKEVVGKYLKRLPNST